MIPLQISIENFMCYKERVDSLNLEDIHVACLSGKNGHGKTALLDAITWALWGKSRSRTQDELLHQGENSMQVTLDFSAQTQKYRVTRIHSKGRGVSSGKTELNLEIISNGSTTSIMGNTIRDTEQQIIKLLNLDYETFINTSYLRQGDADHFTKSKPSERKQILSEVLDLSYYEYLENISKEKSKNFNAQVVTSKLILSSKLLNMPDKLLLLEKLHATEKSIEKLIPKEKELSMSHSKLLSKKETINRDKSEQSRLKSSIGNSSKELGQLKIQFNNWNNEISDLENLVARSHEISNKKTTFDEMADLLIKYNYDLFQFKDLEKELIILEQSVKFEETTISKDLVDAKYLYESQLKPALKSINTLTGQILSLKTNISNNIVNFQNLKLSILDKDNIAHQIKELEIQNKILDSNMTETRDKFNILEEIDATCPICDQNLDPHAKNKITSHLKKSGLESKTLYIKNNKKISELQIRCDDLNLYIANNEKTIIDLEKTLASSLIESNVKLEHYNNLITQIPEVEKKISEISSTIENKTFSLLDRGKISEIYKKISLLSYDPQKHTHAQNSYAKLKEYNQLYIKLEQAKQRTESITELINGNLTSSAKRESEILVWKSALSKIERNLIEIIDIDSDITKSTIALAMIREDSQKLISEKNIIENQIETTEKTKREIRKLNNQIKIDSNEVEIYNELSSAFGRNGIQALLIERAVPQIQNTANQLLSRLTHNRMSIKLNFQKGRIDRLTGIHSEELDISISDEIGTRSYETFSGGETFRIDFAIRISLSKLLASRSGAPLPILFIDEGFGSQDAEGQERLIEAIQSIQDDFEKIIVITHIEQMKEHFDQIIQVVKTDAGSKIQIN